MMFGAVIAVAVLGTARVGGVAEVWKRNFDTARIEFFKYKQILYLYKFYWETFITSVSAHFIFSLFINFVKFYFVMCFIL